MVPSHLFSPFLYTNNERFNLPGGAVDKNLPANAGHMGPERPHMPWSNWTHVPQVLKRVLSGPQTATAEPGATLIEAHMP